LLKKLLNNQFYKTISYNGFVVFFKVVSAYVVSKVSAIYLGPSGFAIVGNLKNVLQAFLGITSNGFQSGVIKYVSENNSNKEKLNSIICNVFALNILICLIVSPFIYLFSDRLAIYVLKDVSFTYVFHYLSFFLPLISFNFLIIYIVNGLQKLKLYTYLVSISNILNALLTFVFVYYFSLKGALIGSLLIPSFSFILFFVFKDIRVLFFQAFSNMKSISLEFFKAMSTYLFMAIYSSVLISLCYLFIRNTIIDTIDLESAGLWEAMNKISTFYMLFFSSLLTLYLLPKLSKNKTIEGYYKIMSYYFKSLIPIVVVVFVILFFFRIILIKLFLTKEFLQVSDFFYLQLIGDFFKIIAFSLAYQFHAKKMVSAYLISDAILYGLFYFLSIFFIDSFKLNGVFYAYLLSTFLYLLAVLFFSYKLRYKYLKTENV
jgi:polysaccharide transporter, PST family